MRKLLLALSPMLLSSLIQGCVSLPPTYTASYQITLREVERPKEAKVRYGEPKITPVDENGIQKFYFEDEMVKILFFPSPAQIEFLLNNKTDHSIKIIWDEASYVDQNGVGHRTLHQGTKLADRNAPQAPTVVIRKGSISDLIYPSDYVSWTGSSWYHQPLLPNESSSGIYAVVQLTREDLEKQANATLGKTIQVLLPLQIEDVVNEYIFSFGINKVTLGCKSLGTVGLVSQEECKKKE